VPTPVDAQLLLGSHGWPSAPLRGGTGKRAASSIRAQRGGPTDARLKRCPSARHGTTGRARQGTNARARRSSTTRTRHGITAHARHGSTTCARKGTTPGAGRPVIGPLEQVVHSGTLYCRVVRRWVTRHGKTRESDEERASVEGQAGPGSDDILSRGCQDMEFGP